MRIIYIHCMISRSKYITDQIPKTEKTISCLAPRGVFTCLAFRITSPVQYQIPDVVLCCCVPSASTFDELWCFSVQRGCTRCLFQLLYSSYQLKAAWLMFCTILYKLYRLLCIKENPKRLLKFQQPCHGENHRDHVLSCKPSTWLCMIFSFHWKQFRFITRWTQLDCWFT